MDWNEKLIADCAKTLNKWYEAFIPLSKKVLIPEEFLLPLYDDLNTPGYIANLHMLFDKAINGDIKDKEIFVSACNFVGFLSQTKEEWLDMKIKNLEIDEKTILLKLDERNKARNDRNFALADKIRDELMDKGIQIEDKDGKTTWKLI